MTDTEICPGNPEGHMWILERTDPEYYAVRKMRKSFFKKRDIVEPGAWLVSLRMRFFIKKWYCSKCRTTDFTYHYNDEEILSWDDHDKRIIQMLFDKNLAVRNDDKFDKLFPGNKVTKFYDSDWLTPIKKDLTQPVAYA